jgi:uridine phosphorylase
MNSDDGETATEATAEEPQYHLDVTSDDVADCVLLPGDPGRIEAFTDVWDTHEERAANREYRTVTGTYREADLSVTSTGIGSPSAAIAVEELAEVGAETLVRVGSSGGIQPHLEPGELVISTGAVRREGTSEEYVRESYPAVADYEVVCALVTAAERLDYDYHTGLTVSTDSFSVGQGRTGLDGFESATSAGIVEELRSTGALNFEMEASAIFTLASIYDLRAGAVCTVDSVRGKNESSRDSDEWERRAVETASLAVSILRAMDDATDSHATDHWHADLTVADE